LPPHQPSLFFSHHQTRFLSGSCFFPGSRSFFRHRLPFFLVGILFSWPFQVSFERLFVAFLFATTTFFKSLEDPYLLPPPTFFFYRAKPSPEKEIPSWTQVPSSLGPHLPSQAKFPGPFSSSEPRFFSSKFPKGGVVVVLADFANGALVIRPSLRVQALQFHPPPLEKQLIFYHAGRIWPHSSPLGRKTLLLNVGQLFPRSFFGQLLPIFFCWTVFSFEELSLSLPLAIFPTELFLLEESTGLRLVYPPPFHWEILSETPEGSRFPSVPGLFFELPPPVPLALFFAGPFSFAWPLPLFF